MTEGILEDVVADLDMDRVDREYIRDRFVETGREYVERSSDTPTIRQVSVHVEHFADRDPDDISDEALALLWTQSSLFRWMLQDLPLQGETTDPEWLREQLRIWEMAESEDPTNY